MARSALTAERLETSEISGSHGNFRIASGNFRITRKLPHQKRRSVEDRVWLAQPKPPSGWKLPKLPAMLNGGVAAARGRRLVRCLARGTSSSWVVVPREYAVSTP